MLLIHQWFLYTVLALEVVPQTALIAVLSAVGGFLVWWSQLEPSVSCRPSCDTDGDDYRHIVEDDYHSALISLVAWYARPPRCNPCTQAATHAPWLQPHAPSLQTHALRTSSRAAHRSLIFHALGLRHTTRRRAGLLRHAQHRQRANVCAEHIMEEVEACKKLLANMFPPQAPSLHATPLARTPATLTAHMRMCSMRMCMRMHVHYACTQVLSELQLNLRLGASERAAVVAQEFEGCTFLFAKLVGLRHLVESADPRWLLELLQTTFDSFDTLAETFSVQRVRKTVNESYMVAAGLPDPTLLRSPVDRALATAGFGLALCGVMDVLNAQMAQRMGGRGGKHGASRGGGGAPPMLAVQVGINSGSAIAGVIGHRRIQYDLVGDAVNTAARMCSYGAPGRVHVSAATYEHLAPHYLATSRGPLQVCTRPPAAPPPHLCTAAPLHLCTAAPPHLCRSSARGS